MTYTPVLDCIFRHFGSRTPKAKPLKERIFDVEGELRRLERQVSFAHDEGAILMARTLRNELGKLKTHQEQRASLGTAHTSCTCQIA
jgi:hypothetical protein